MFIECPNCYKKFDVNQNLIPQSGRLVQCGSCKHTWLYKKFEEPEIKDIQILKDNKINENKINKNINIKINNNNINKIPSKKKYEIVKKETELSNEGLNYFKIFLVTLITFVALVLVLDTFKIYISGIFPNINNILNNLYNSLIDIFLFFKDLVK